MTETERLALERLAEISLASGGHNDRSNGLCAMEIVSWLAGEPHSDKPTCTCPVLGAFVRSWNDSITNDETRTKLLRPFLPRLVGTRSTPAIEERRSYLALDWLIRVHTPEWLDLIEALKVQALALRGLPEITNLETAQQAGPVVRAAGDAARDAAWAAAWAAAGDAAWAAARAAAWDAAWAAGGAAALEAAGAAFVPTVAKLQESAAQLLDRMIRLTEERLG